MKKTLFVLEDPKFLGRIPVRTDLPVIPTGKETGWMVCENVGLGVANIWIFVPEPIRRRLQFVNRFSIYLFFRTDPIVKSGKYLGWKIKFHNPVREYIAHRKYMKQYKGRYRG